MADEADNQSNSETPKQSFQGSVSHQITAAGVLSLVKMVLTVAQQKYSRLAYTESVDEVDEKKENLLAKVEAMLAQKIERTKLITFHWSIV